MHLHQKPPFIFFHTKPWLTEEEMRNQKTSFLFVEIDDLYIYQNDEEKYEADFYYGNQNYEGFSITDPKFKVQEKKCDLKRCMGKTERVFSFEFS